MFLAYCLWSLSNIKAFMGFATFQLLVDVWLCYFCCWYYSVVFFFFPFFIYYYIYLFRSIYSNCSFALILAPLDCVDVYINMWVCLWYTQEKLNWFIFWHRVTNKAECLKAIMLFLLFCFSHFSSFYWLDSVESEKNNNGSANLWYYRQHISHIHLVCIFIYTANSLDTDSVLQTKLQLFTDITNTSIIKMYV